MQKYKKQLKRISAVIMAFALTLVFSINVMAAEPDTFRAIDSDGLVHEFGVYGDNGAFAGYTKWLIKLGVLIAPKDAEVYFLGPVSSWRLVTDPGTTITDSNILAKLNGPAYSTWDNSGNKIIAGVVSVSFSATADGSATAATTKATLTFDKNVTGLAAADITVTGAGKGTLSGGPAVYELGLSGITADGNVTIAVAKSGYTFVPASVSVQVYGTPSKPDEDGALIDTPATKASATANSITVYEATLVGANPGGQTIEYAINQSATTTPTSSWQDELTFTGLTADTEYYVWARSKATTGYKAGVAKASEAIKTEGGLPPAGVTVTLTKDLIDNYLMVEFTEGTPGTFALWAFNPVDGIWKSAGGGSNINPSTQIYNGMLNYEKGWKCILVEALSPELTNVSAALNPLSKPKPPTLTDQSYSPTGTGVHVTEIQ